LQRGRRLFPGLLDGCNRVLKTLDRAAFLGRLRDQALAMSLNKLDLLAQDAILGNGSRVKLGTNLFKLGFERRCFGKGALPSPPASCQVASDCWSSRLASLIACSSLPICSLSPTRCLSRRPTFASIAATSGQDLRGEKRRSGPGSVETIGRE